MIGKTLGHYQITEKLGEGGMGVVYKARDTHLDRFVAIKVLPAEKVADLERKRRFVQEAKAASALNHPNIVHIYDIDQADGTDFIAMEYVAGKTLDHRIGHRGLRLNDALKYAVQIADALAKAHSAGIVHRDLKPTNIMVNEDGVVKVLDFGLAKLTEQAEGDESASTATVDAEGKPITEQGVIIGTVAYMSPEQAEGRKVDARSDIFSLGSVLYEMVTGQKAFQGTSKISTLSAILHQEPKPVSGITPTMPADFEKLISRCLRKDPAKRLQHMDDVKLALEELQEDSDSGKLQIPGRAAARRRPWLALAGGLVVLAGAGVLAWWLIRSPAALPPPSPTRLTSDSGLTMDPMLSPDGTRVAYTSDRAGRGDLDIWIQQVTTGDRLRLTQNEADEHEPAFSPDGSRIAYRSEQDGGGIHVVSTLGGEPRRLVRGGRRPRFSPNGGWIAYWVGGQSTGQRWLGSLCVIPSAGGQPRQIREDFKRAWNPEWSQDGRHILFLADRGSDRPDVDVWATSLDEDGGPAVCTGLAEILRKQNIPNWSFAQWSTNGSGDGRLLLSAHSAGSGWLSGDEASNIWRVPISSRSFQVQGPAEQLTFGTARQSNAQAVQIAEGRLRMVFASIRSNVDIWSLPLEADHALVRGAPQRITDQESPEMHPGISEDGRKLVYYSLRNGSLGVWGKDLASGKETVVSAAYGSAPSISRNGRRVVYTGPRGPRGAQIYMVAEGDPVLVCDDCAWITSMTGDGEMLIDQPPLANSLRVVMTARREAVPILKHPAWQVAVGRLSPDEHWIAFTAIPSIDTRQVYVAPFRGPVPVDEGEWIAVTNPRVVNRYATWSPDGNTLYYLSDHDGFRCILAQRLDPVSKLPVGPAIDIYHFHHARLSLMSIADPAGENLQIASDKAVLAIEERTGNIWITEWKQR